MAFLADTQASAANHCFKFSRDTIQLASLQTAQEVSKSILLHLTRFHTITTLWVNHVASAK